jgi:hypothetical protein
MDPTEKGAINYFLGLLICKLFSWRLLDAPWTLHLDVFRSVLRPQLLAGRSRPDMVAQSNSTGQWHAFECKGRATVPANPEKKKAKTQAERVTSVGGITCTLHIGAITFFKNDGIEFYWRDPEPPARELLALPDPDSAWGAYYGPAAQVIRDRLARAAAPGGFEVSTMLQVDELDLSIGVHPGIGPLLLDARWLDARNLARHLREELASSGFRPDGLRIQAGSSWLERFEMGQFG